MNAIGMFFSNLPSSSSEELYVDQMIPLQSPKGTDTLIGVGITKYHLYFLHQNALYIVAKVTQQIVHTIEFEKRQGYEMVGIIFNYLPNYYRTRRKTRVKILY